jgi:hypothetical protein
MRTAEMMISSVFTRLAEGGDNLGTEQLE